MLFGDSIYLLFALLMPLFFAIVVFLFIRSIKKQNESLQKKEKESTAHKQSSEN